MDFRKAVRPIEEAALDEPCCRRGLCDLWVYLPKKGPLCEHSDTTIEAYRFMWCSSFDGEALVRVARGEKGINLYWARSSFLHGNGRFWTGIGREAWDRFAAAVLAAGFWALDPEDDTHGLDGAFRTIKGRRRDVYRVIRRWSPRDRVFDLGGAFLDVADPPIAETRLY